jgi:hypothetical protein
VLQQIHDHNFYALSTFCRLLGRSPVPMVSSSVVSSCFTFIVESEVVDDELDEEDASVDDDEEEEEEEASEAAAAASG